MMLCCRQQQQQQPTRHSVQQFRALVGERESCTLLSSNAVGAAASFLQRQLNTFSQEGVWVVLEAVSRVNCTCVHCEHHSRTVTSSSNTVCGSMISHCRTLKRGEPPAARRLSTSGAPLYAALLSVCVHVGCASS